MSAPLKLTLAQSAFVVFMYLIGAVILGLALFPPLLNIIYYWKLSAHLSLGLRILILSFFISSGYFIFGLLLIVITSLARVVLGLQVKEGVHPVGSIPMLKWMMASALYIAVRGTFMEFILLTPFCAAFYKLMGATIGQNVQINSSRVGDISLLEIGDNSVIGGNATVICHSFEKNGLHIKKVKIGKNVIIGLNAIVLPGCEIGDGAVIAAGAVLPKDTKVEAKSVYLGINKSNPA